MATDAFSGVPNLGKEIAARLRASGFGSMQQLAEFGPVNAYRRLCEQAGRRLPRCYYLYSLEAALRGIPWTELTEAEKRQLRLAADRELGQLPPAEVGGAVRR